MPTELAAAHFDEGVAFVTKFDVTPAFASTRFANFGISLDLSGSSLVLVSTWFTKPKPQDRAYTARWTTISGSIWGRNALGYNNLPQVRPNVASGVHEGNSI